MKPFGKMGSHLGVGAVAAGWCAAVWAAWAADSEPAGAAERKLEALGIELPRTNSPIANYVPAARTGNLIFLSGAIAKNADGSFVKGKLGADTTAQEGYAAARTAAISLLASLLVEIGDLDRVERIVKVEGFVNATPNFTQQSQVINGCSDLLVEVFG